jgi:hypothetical protein
VSPLTAHRPTADGDLLAQVATHRRTIRSGVGSRIDRALTEELARSRSHLALADIDKAGLAETRRPASRDVGSASGGTLVLR